MVVFDGLVACHAVVSLAVTVIFLVVVSVQYISCIFV